MKALIVEDEYPAAEMLREMIAELNFEIEVIKITSSIKESVEWLSVNSVDLIFMDIKIEDGISFEIFKQIELDTPVIFTTAYDKFAIDAFKVNSIDYLLKPISKDKLLLSIKKFMKSSVSNNINYSILKELIPKKTNYLKSFLIQIGNKIIKLNLDKVAYFYAYDKAVFAMTYDDNKYPIDNSLEKLKDELDPECFFHISRQFIISENAISSIVPYSRGRLKIEVKPTNPDKVEALVSIEKTREFKKWITGK